MGGDGAGRTAALEAAPQRCAEGTAEGGQGVPVTYRGGWGALATSREGACGSASGRWETGFGQHTRVIRRPGEQHGFTNVHVLFGFSAR